MTDDPTWAIGFYNAGVDDRDPDDKPDPDDGTCDQCGKPSEQLIEKGRRLICRACDEDNQMDAAEAKGED